MTATRSRHVGATERRPSSRRAGIHCPPAPIVVLTVPGTSLTDPAGISRVARSLVAATEGGARVVAVVPAVDGTTDALHALAQAVSLHPDARELDMVLSVAGQISCALVAMAIAELGRESVSLAAPQAGILTDERHGKAAIVGIRAQRIRSALERGQIVLVARDQGLFGDEITTFDHGGGDALALALAAALGTTLRPWPHSLRGKAREAALS